MTKEQQLAELLKRFQTVVEGGKVPRRPPLSTLHPPPSTLHPAPSSSLLPPPSSLDVQVGTLDPVRTHRAPGAGWGVAEAMPGMTTIRKRNQ